jgi:hypothetical protein
MFKSTKIETSIQRSDSAKSDSDNPSSLQDTKLRPSVDSIALILIRFLQFFLLVYCVDLAFQRDV